MAVVARGRDDDNAAEPELLDRLVERILREVARNRGVQREVRDADVVLRLVVVDPLGRRDHVARPGHAVVVHDVERDELRARRGARVVRAVARSDPGHERAVAAAVTGRVRNQLRDHLFGDDPGTTLEVDAVLVDPGVDDRDRRRGRAIPVGVRVEGSKRLGRRPDLVRGRRRVELDPRVARDREPGPPGQDEHALRLHRGRDRADEPEPSVQALSVAEGVTLAGRLVGVLGVRGAVVALDDDVDERVRGRVRLGLEQGIEIGRWIGAPAGLRQRDRRDEQDCEDRQKSSAALAPQSVRARISASIPGPPEGARTSPVRSDAAMS